MVSIIKNTQNYLIILIIFTLTNSPAYSQKTNQKREFRFITTSNGRHNTHIEFIDTLTNKVRNSFDIRAHNPYNTLDYYSDSTNRHGYHEYKFDKIRLKDVNLNHVNFVQNKNFPDTFLIENAIGTSSDVVLANNYYSSYIIVKYNFFLIQETSLLGQSSSLVILSSSGNIVQKMNSFTRQCDNACVTEDGKYLALTFGGVADESLEFFDKVGVQIIDLKNDEIVVEDQFDFPVYETVTNCFDNLIRLTCKKVGKVNTYVVYDFNKGKKYTKDYPVSILGSRRGVTDSGFLFEIPRGSNNIRTDYYETDFFVEDIK